MLRHIMTIYICTCFCNIHVIPVHAVLLVIQKRSNGLPRYLCTHVCMFTKEVALLPDPRSSLPTACHKAWLRYKSCPWRRGWFELPATQITDEVKRDLRLLHLRSALDPKRFYKGFDQTKFPKYFQLGTVVEGAAEFYSGKVLVRGATRVSVCLLRKNEGLIFNSEVFVLSPWTRGSLLNCVSCRHCH